MFYKILIRNVVDDTMLKHWEAFPELDKDLGTLCSLYTRVPYYKQERKDNDLRTFWTYCGKDCVVTHEVNTRINTELATNVGGIHNYRRNVNLLPAFLYMEIRGIRYDSRLAAERRKDVVQKLYAAQYEIDSLAGRVFTPDSSVFEVMEKTGKTCCSWSQSKQSPTFFAPTERVHEKTSSPPTF